MILKKVVYSSSIYIGALEVSPPLFLAPMAGLTHSALRCIIADFGGCGFLSTEMLSARSLAVENPSVSPYLIRTEKETPLSYQLLAGRPEEVPQAIEAVEDLGAAAVDLNLGCGAPRVRRAGRGIALWDHDARLEAVAREIRRRTDLPFTAKIRLGPGPDTDELKRRVTMLEDLGLDGLYVHARFDREPFSRRPKWELIRKVKDRLCIPVIVNGGIFSVENAVKCLEQSGADGLMIGRAAAVTPWIFSMIASKIYSADISEREIDLPAIFQAFYHGLVSRFPAERQLGRLKEFTHYFSRNYPFGNRLAMAVQRAGSMQEALCEALSFFEKNKGTDHCSHANGSLGNG